MLDELTKRLTRAKDAYCSEVAQIDVALKPIIAAHPELTSEVRSFQKGYAVAPEHASLGPLKYGGVDIQERMQAEEDKREKTKSKK